MPWIKNSNKQDKDILFIHIPKTGGRFITQKLLEYGDNHLKWTQPLHPIKQHYTLSDLISNYDIDVQETFIFTLVRHPVTKIMSTYNFCKNTRKKFSSFDSFLDMIYKSMANMSISFSNDYMTNYLYQNGIDLNHIKPQLEFVNYNNIPIHYYRVEDQLDLFKERMSREFSIDLSGLSYQNDYFNCMSINQEYRIMDLYKDDLDYFKW